MVGDKITAGQKELVSDFIKYCDSLNNITRTTNIAVSRLSSKTNSKEDSIYTPEIYLAYINEIMNIERLTPLAIRVQSIANTWLYIIMHLSDLWRSSSIIDDLPIIEIEEINITSFSWFKNNTLSIDQAQIIVNQVQLKVKNSIASKNKAVLYFHVIPELAVPFATAAVLCELHRRQKEQKLLLHTLRSGLVKKVRDKFFSRHDLSNSFQSIKMNRSTSTYLFYSVLEEDGPDSDIALELTSMLRSHKKLTSTEIYLNNTNKDGSINRVSINVFRRGHFGWLFNYIVSMASETSPTSHRLEQKTLQIEELRRRLKPYEIEAWGKFITEKKERDRSVIAELSAMPQEYFKQLVKKILLGKMPSRQENGQCLVHPKCSFTNKLKCMDCKYFIPQSYMLIEAVEELKRISLSLENSKYDAIRERDSKLFLYIFILFNEAYQALGKEYVDSFLAKEEFTRIVKKTSEFLKLPVQ
ncbi:hypothetical protein MKX42_23675 [Paenibacillus sp. FSL R7-0204]|uniref:hypothetical protein n=1 Tax=Paenibacillus sp. FSL R7-0204 TaxID=2921675 RepID=UPI0030F6E101